MSSLHYKKRSKTYLPYAFLATDEVHHVKIWTWWIDIIPTNALVKAIGIPLKKEDCVRIYHYLTFLSLLCLLI